ncbi:hypothetical protein [Chryseobacterium sp.]|uniref:hypothetical protein n=1 Tax=Chryseobacterium sp. TaxID=1871047 RepID=UPI002631253D|nr:hypothetical protein [Chryseobacterium sp.]
MVKNYFLKMFAGIAFLGLLAACNTTSDPTESIPDPDPGIPPQKVLTKISVNNVSREEYMTTPVTGILQQSVFKDESATNVSAYYTGTVTYTDKNITKVKFVSSATASLAYEFNIIPDGTGKKIYNATCTGTGTTPALSHVSDYTFSYDVATDKLTKILEKRKAGGISAYNRFIEYAFVYTGNEVFQVVCTKGILDINGAPEQGTATVTKYNFQNYDGKKSPFSTLPSTYFIMQGLIDPINFYRLSPSNPTSMYIQTPSSSTNTAQSYSYDNQGYPVIEKNQNLTYSYKNL